MGRLAFKSDGKFQGIVTRNNVEYTNEQLDQLKKEFYNLETNLAKKCGNKYDSEYCYELGLILSDKLVKYDILVNSRQPFWAMLREYVNEIDNRKVFQTKQREPYERCYLLSKLPKKLVLKYSMSKWDHFFDITTARKDERIYNWMMENNNENFINNNSVFQNFLKCVKDYTINIDLLVLSDEDLYKIYDDAMYKAIFLVDFMKKQNIKLNSKERSDFFIKVKQVDFRETSELLKIVENIV